MATNGCSPLKFFCTSKEAFYFEAAQTDVDEDAFQMSVHPCDQHLIQSNDNKFVILNTEGQFQVQNLTKDQQCQPDNKFCIQIYSNSILGARKERAVMLYVNKDGKKMVACCNEKHEICPEEMDLPRQIGEDGHKAVFYRTELSTSKYTLESSLYPTQFLGFAPDGDDHTLYKLVLRHKGRAEVDESCEIFFS